MAGAWVVVNISISSGRRCQTCPSKESTYKAYASTCGASPPVVPYDSGCLTFEEPIFACVLGAQVPHVLIQKSTCKAFSGGDVVAVLVSVCNQRTLSRYRRCQPCSSTESITRP